MLSVGRSFSRWYQAFDTPSQPIVLIVTGTGRRSGLKTFFIISSAPRSWTISYAVFCLGSLGGTYSIRIMSDVAASAVAGAAVPGLSAAASARAATGAQHVHASPAAMTATMIDDRPFGNAIAPLPWWRAGRPQ